MVDISFEISFEEAKILVEELWFLKQVRKDEGNSKSEILLDAIFQIVSAKVNSVKHEEEWANLMQELEQGKIK